VTRRRSGDGSIVECTDKDGRKRYEAVLDLGTINDKRVRRTKVADSKAAAHKLLQEIEKTQAKRGTIVGRPHDRPALPGVVARPTASTAGSRSA
jgi:hypothetical protein